MKMTTLTILGLNSRSAMRCQTLFSSLEPAPVGCKRWRHSGYRVSSMFPFMKDRGSAAGPNKKQGQGARSQKLLIHHRLVQGASTGTFYMLPEINRVLEKLQKVIVQEMRSVGAQKISMPCFSPASLWKASGRWDVMGSELLTLEDRHGAPHCLSPTHEEAVTSIVAAEGPISHKHLPIKLYQIGRKFRDEMRPKNGLLRCREFEMKDLYTFDKDEESALITYEEVCGAYERIFTRLNLEFLKVEGDTGAMGGRSSQEFHILSTVGEDTLYVCTQCGKGLNSEMVSDKGLSSYKCGREDCILSFEEKAGIEVAHAFVLGTKYSEIFDAVYKTEDGRTKTLYMGCYGIGVTRLISAALEALSPEENHIKWPKLIAPHQICVIPQKDGYRSDETMQLAEDIFGRLSDLPNLRDEVVLDDRTNLSIGRRQKQAEFCGFPYTIIVGKKALEEVPLYECVDTNTNKTETLNAEELIDYMSKVETIVV